MAYCTIIDDVSARDKDDARLAACSAQAEQSSLRRNRNYRHLMTAGLLDLLSLQQICTIARLQQGRLSRRL